MPTPDPVPTPEPSPIGPRLKRIALRLAAFSVVTHFDGFQRGVIDLRDLVYFLSVIGFSLFATGVIIRSHRAG